MIASTFEARQYTRRGGPAAMEDVEGLLLQREGAIARITLNRPEKLNALTFAMVLGVTRFVEECGRDDDVRLIVITGAGRAFCSGDDIVGGMGEAPGGNLRNRLSTNRGPHYDMVKTLLGAPKPVVAALNGRCHGAGWVMALACDFRVARSDALLGDIRSEKAIFANQGAGLMLPRLIGQSRAMDLLMTGRVIDAVEAERYGIVTRLWPPQTYEAELASFLEGLAAGPTKTYAAWKLTINRSLLLELDAYTDYERWANMALGDTEDRREGVQAFREKRQPRFVGR
jgi:2-(1,2-epoxy-1,2-dihydrophenyl)acetyl-CoA isomerase